MTAPMTAPLDEARLRELAEARVKKYLQARASGAIREAQDCAPLGKEVAYRDRVLDSATVEVGYRDLRMVLDALSAERERGDRAVKVIERLSSSEAFECPMVIDGPLAPEIRARMSYADAFLAAQKAEGAPDAA